MANEERNLRNRKVAYDNLAVGSDTSLPERVIAGATGPSQVWGMGENIAVASDYGPELVIVAGTALLAGERLGS